MSPIAFAVNPNLPELLTKQAVGNIRFLSDDGTITYFQKSSGTFHFTHHYQTFDLLKATPQTQFYVSVSPLKKKIVVEAYENFLSAHQFFKERTIYEGDFLGKKLNKIGEGMNPQLHLNDAWVSFYNGKKREITLVKIGATTKPVTIKLKYKVNPYFIPQIVLVNETTAVLTEMTAEGNQVIFRFDLLTGAFLQTYKTPAAGSKLELCYNGQNLYVGQFGLGDVSNGSAIFSIDMDAGVTLKKMDLIYSSTKNDIGNIICEASDDEIYFIQAQVKENDINIKNTELALLKVNSKEVTQISTFGDATQVIRMDHRVVIPYRGKFYVAKGENNLKSDELLKKKEDPKEQLKETVLDEGSDTIEVAP